MNWVNRFLKRDQWERQLQAELQFHVERQIFDNIRAGMSEEAARREARLKFGGLEHVKEECRDAKGTRWIETAFQDVQFALRIARKNPGFVLAAVCTLALGIGANTAIFSVVSGVLLRPLPFVDPHRLVQLEEFDPRNGLSAVSYLDMTDWRKQSASFEAMIAYGEVSRNLQDVPQPERIATVWAERGLFRMLGVEPLAGRTFREDDPLDVVVVGAGFWRRRFGGDPSFIGRKIVLDGEPYTVIGVMPEAFQFPYRSSHTELWIPWRVPPQWEHDRNYRIDFVAARLKSGIDIEAAGNELNVIAKRLEAQFPDTNKDHSAVITPLREVVTGRVRPALLTLLGAVGLVLLIACANVMNLLLARAAGRTHEVAVRVALGASRRRLIRQFLTESVLLSSIAGLAGLLIATFGTDLILKLASPHIPRSWEVALDWRVFSFLLVVSLGTGVVFGLVPALVASRINVQTGLKQASGGRPEGRSSSEWSGQRLRDGLIVAEIALAFVLLVGAGVLLRAFIRLQNTPSGFVAENVLTMRLAIDLRQYSAPGAYGRYLQELEERLGKVPGVRGAGFIQYLPLHNWGWNGFFSIRGRTPRTDAQQPRAELRYVSPGYFHAMGIPIRRGRGFTNRDISKAPRVILINEALSSRYFPNQDPVGQQTDRGPVIGVVGNVRGARLDRPATPEIYYAFAQNTAATSDAGVSLVVRAQLPPKSMAGIVRSIIHQINPNQVVFDVKTMQDVVADSLADVNFYVWLLGLFAGIAFLLAMAGIYAVISYVVAGRTHEFGIRLALGAGRPQILRLVLWHGAVLIGCGLALGTAAAFATTRVLKSLLDSVTALDPMIFTATGILLALVALAACLIPALRATRVDPGRALRCE